MFELQDKTGLEHTISRRNKCLTADQLYRVWSRLLVWGKNCFLFLFFGLATAADIYFVQLLVLVINQSV